MNHDAQMFPIIETGALELAILNREAERLDQMERAPRRGAQACDVSGIRGNQRLDEDDLQRSRWSLRCRDDARLRLGAHALASSTVGLSGGEITYATPPP